MVSGSASASYGSFYDGTRTTAGYSGRVGVSPHFAIEPSLTFNWVRLPYGDFDGCWALMNSRGERIFSPE
jgi:hypothetical protein